MKSKTQIKRQIPIASSRIPAPLRLRPTHLEIAAEAEVLWRQRGCPSGQDNEIWLEAERQLHRVARLAKDEADIGALSDPLSRLDSKSDDVMGELEELFPSPTGKSATSL
ncbi:MAG: DUF2934 domain-containing protein [Opitutaceae bacterium]|jgi:hypothetical protein